MCSQQMSESHRTKAHAGSVLVDKQRPQLWVSIIQLKRMKSAVAHATAGMRPLCMTKTPGCGKTLKTHPNLLIAVAGDPALPLGLTPQDPAGAPARAWLGAMYTDSTMAWMLLQPTLKDPVI